MSPLENTKVTPRNDIVYLEEIIARKNERIAELEAENKALREQVRWVPVSERLPDNFDRVLACNADGFVETKMGRRMYESPKLYPHWMPLPPPPQEQDK